MYINPLILAAYNTCDDRPRKAIEVVRSGENLYEAVGAQ